MSETEVWPAELTLNNAAYPVGAVISGRWKIRKYPDHSPTSPWFLFAPYGHCMLFKTGSDAINAFHVLTGGNQ